MNHEIFRKFRSDGRLFMDQMRIFHGDRWIPLPDSSKAEELAKLLSYPFTRRNPNYDLAMKFLANRSHDDEAALIALMTDDVRGTLASEGVKLLKLSAHLEKDIYALEIDVILEKICNLFGIRFISTGEINSEDLRVSVDRFAHLDDTYPQFEEGTKNRFIVPRAKRQVLKLPNRSKNHELVNSMDTTLSVFPAESGVPLVDHYGNLIRQEFEKCPFALFLSPTGSGKSTTLVLWLTQYFSTTWILVPSNAAANLLYQTYKQLGVKCGLRCGRPSVEANPMFTETNLMVMTYGSASKIIANGYLPELLICDEINIECDDRDFVLHMLKADLYWQNEGTKVLGLSADTPSDARITFDMIQTRPPVQRIKMDEQLFTHPTLDCTFPTFLLPMIRDVLYALVDKTETPQDASMLLEQFVSGQVEAADLWVARFVAARNDLIRILDAFQLPTFQEIVGEIERILVPQRRPLWEYIAKNWRPMAKALWPDDSFPFIDVPVELVMAFLNITATRSQDWSNPEIAKVPMVFCRGMAEMKRMRKEIRLRTANMVDVIIFHSETVTADVIEKIAAPPSGEFDSVRRVILASSMAETSVTFANVAYVIDTRVVKKDFVNPVLGEIKTVLVKATRGQSQQRRGRTGRTVAGVYAQLPVNLPSDLPNFDFGVPKDSMRDVMGVVLQAVVFNMARDQQSPKEPLKEALSLVTKHSQEVVGAVIDKLEEMSLLVKETVTDEDNGETEVVYITRAGYEVYCLPCNVESGYLVVVGARMGVFRSCLWYAALLEEFPEGSFKFWNNDEQRTQWELFFRMASTYNLERMTDFRSIAYFLLQTRNQFDSCIRGEINHNLFRRCRIWIAKAERMMRRLYPNVPDIPLNQVAVDGGLNRNEDIGAVALMAGLIGSRHAIVRIISCGSGIYRGEHIAISAPTRVEEYTSRVLPDVGFAGPVFTNVLGERRIPSVTAVPNLMSAVLADLLCDPSNVLPEQFDIGNITYKSEQAARIILLRRRFKCLMQKVMSAPVTQHPAFFNQDIDNYVNLLLTDITPILHYGKRSEAVVLFDPSSRSKDVKLDEDLVRRLNEMRIKFYVPDIGEIKRPRCAIRSRVWLPASAAFLDRGSFCLQCFTRGHSEHGCPVGCEFDCNHTGICPATRDERLKRRLLLLEGDIFDAVVPREFSTPIYSMLLSAKSGNQLSLYKYIFGKFDGHCRLCNSPLHNKQHDMCSIDERLCFTCKFRHRESLIPESCYVIFHECNLCRLPIHVAHRCEEAKRYIHKKYGPQFTMVDFRRHLDRLHPRRSLTVETTGAAVNPPQLSPEVIANAILLPANPEEWGPCYNPSVVLDRRAPNRPNDYHLFSHPSLTY